MVRHAIKACLFNSSAPIEILSAEAALLRSIPATAKIEAVRKMAEDASMNLFEVNPRAFRLHVSLRMSAAEDYEVVGIRDDVRVKRLAASRDTPMLTF